MHRIGEVKKKCVTNESMQVIAKTIATYPTDVARELVNSNLNITQRSYKLAKNVILMVYEVVALCFETTSIHGHP